MMTRSMIVLTGASLSLLAVQSFPNAAAKNLGLTRMVRPGPAPGAPPSDAVRLFDGTNLEAWKSARGGGDALWELKDGIMTVEPGTGDLYSTASFGDCQLHMEWRLPDDAGTAKHRGNSGIKLHTRYEVQVIHSFGRNKDLKHDAGSIYAQTPPLVNASLKPGQWQTYDIIFRAPRFDSDGKRIKKGTLTVFHNGVLVQDHVEIDGPTNSKKPAKPGYKKPILLQDHGARVSYRNIWLRPLDDQEP